MTLSLVLLFLFLSAPEVFLTPRHCNNIRYNNNDNNSNVAAVAAVKKIAGQLSLDVLIQVCPLFFSCLSVTRIP